MSDGGATAPPVSPSLEERLRRGLGRLRAGSAGEGIPRWESGAAAPLSFGQRRLWFLERLVPGSAAFHIGRGVELAGRLSRPALAAAFAAAVARHPVLTTAFTEEGGEPVQRPGSAPPPPLRAIDLAALPAASARRELARLETADSRRPFRLDRPPLVRAFLARLPAAGDGDGRHVLWLTFHHIVADGASLEVLLRDLSALYRAGFGASAAALAPSAIDYGDWATWQRSRLSGEVLERQVEWWRRALAGMPPVLELPGDRPPAPRPALRGRRHVRPLPGALAAGVRRFAADRQATPFMVGLAAFSALLARWSGQRRLVVGTPVAGRDAREAEDLVGFFVNTLPLPVDLGGRPTFGELVVRVRRGTLDALDHADAPFDAVVEALAPRRSLSHTPLFQVVFAFESAPPAVLDLPGTTATPRLLDRPPAQFDLNLTLVPEPGGGLAAHLVLAADRFLPATAERLLASFECLLAAALAAPETPVERLPVVTPDERRRLLAAAAGAARPYPRGTPVHELVMAAAARRPAATALVAADGGEVSYGELASRARAVARALAGRGVGPEGRVGIACGRSPEMVVAILGVAAAGAAYVPLDLDVPPARLAQMIEDAAVGLVLADARGAASLPQGVPALAVAAAEAEGAAGGDGLGAGRMGAPAPPVGDGHLAYVIFTSGSTGRPKGVEVTHGGLANLVHWHLEAYGVGEDDRASHLAGLGFDATVWELWPPLVTGAALCLIDDARRADPQALVEWLAERRVTVTFLPTPLAERAVALDWPAGTALRWLLTGGDVLHGQPPAGRPFRLVNHYGPTEGSVVASAGEVAERPPAQLGGGLPDIGRPIANSRLLLLDEGLEPVPDGVEGELFLGGAGLARGYAGRPRWTAERFVPDPFGRGERLYRTGDRARRAADGRIAFAGRRDGQVKVRGFRVEVGDVEAALTALPEVAAAAVAVRDTPAGEKALVAWVVPATDSEPRLDPSLLRARLAERLPDHLVPAAWVAVAELPLSPNGKVDRAALPEPAWGGGGAEPATPLERRIAGLWCEALGLERVGRDDDFFALGGHSLLAVRLLSRVRSELGAEVPVRRLFEAPTVAALAREVESAAPADDEIPRLAADALLPASLAQERLWFLERLDPGTTAYLIPAVLTLRGELDRGALAAALAEVVRRHRALRTVFVERDGQPWQRMAAAPARLPLRLVDLSALPPARRRREAARRQEAEAARPMRLDGAGPDGGLLLRCRLLRLAGGEHRLAFTFHHLAADGTSVAIFLRELAALYGAARRGQPSPLPEPPVQVADWAAWQRRRLDGDGAAGELDWWRRRLAGAPEGVDLPADRPRRAVPGDRPGSLRRRPPAAVGAAVEALARGGGATPFMVLLAALDALIARWTGEEDVVVGAPVDGRARPEVAGLIGFFLNTLVLRVDVSGRPSFRQLLGRAREAAAGALVHQDVPFERLIEALRPGRDPSRSPFFGVFLNVFPSVEEGVAFDGLEVELAAPAPRHGRFDLTIYVSRDGDGGMRWHWLYDRQLFDPERVEEMARQLEALLVAAAADPERPLGELTLLTAGAAALPDPSAPLSAAWLGSVPEVFARRAAERPEAPAVLAPDGALTYGELARWSGRIARHLAAGGERRGVLPGEPVAIWAHRSGSLVPAVLGTLAAGAAFVMLDPAYPPARLVELVALARPRGFVRLSAAGPLPPEVDAALAAAGCRVRLELGPLSELSEDHPLAAAPAGAPAVELGPDDLAYLAFTSGSTGRPKGIRGRHGSLTHFLPWQVATFGFGAGDRFSLLSGLAHDPLHRDLFTPLQTGGAIVVPEAERIGEPGYLAGWMRRERVTVAHLTPAMGQVVSEPAGRLGAVPEELTAADLRWVFLVGEALTRGHVDRLAAVAPRARAVNFYGSTETQRAVGWHLCAAGGAAGGAAASVTGGAGVRVPGGASADAEVLPLGRGIPDVQLLVVNPAGRPAGVGELGEVWVRSPHVALGYLDDPETTADRFLANPFAEPADPADRAYRTGDLGRYRPDGEVVFAGRADLQLKVRGFRVEPAEIEAAIERHPAVREAVVVLRDDPAAGALLVAYVVPRPGGGAAPAAAPEPRALRDHLAARLPDYMVPAAFVVVDALPRTPNGKLDRRALPAPGAGDGLVARAAAAAPRDPVEEAVVAVFAELLPAAAGPVGIDSDFFDLGGHSLLATRAFSRLAAALGVELPLRAFFDGATPAALAASIRAVAAGGRTAAEEGIPRRAADAGPAPLSFAQERLWFLERLEPGTTYKLAFAVDLDGALDRGALAAALATVVERHEALRTVFAERDGEPEQVVLPAAAVLGGAAAGASGAVLAAPRGRSAVGSGVLGAASRASRPGEPAGDGETADGGSRRADEGRAGARACPPVLDLRWLPAARRDGVAARAAAAFARRPFDLARGPLVATLLVALDAGRHRLVVAVHHVVFDGWSTGLLLGELATAYAAHAAGRPPELAPLPVQYRDFAVWQRRRLAGDGGAALAWWRERLAGVPVLDLPTDRPRPAVRRGRGRTERFEAAEGGAQAAALARRAGGTPYMALAAAFAAVLARWSGQARFALATPVAGRVRREVEPLVGLFVNTLALPFDLGGDPSFGELLARVRDTSLGAFGHGELPFEKLVAELSPERSTSHPPLAQALFSLQNLPETTLDWGPRIAARPRGLDPGGAGFDLALMVREDGSRRAPAGVTAPGALVAALTVDRDLFDAATARRLAGHWRVLLAAAAADPARRLSELPLLAEEERRQVLVEWAHGEPIDPAAAGEGAGARPRGTQPASQPGPLPARAHLADLFAAQAARTPRATALVWGTERWSYGELAARVEEIAARLRRLGVGPEVRVGVFLDRRPELVATLLAVHAAGGAYVPLDPAYPAERVALMLEDSAAAVVVSRRAMLARLPLSPDLPSPPSPPSSPELPAAADRPRSAPGEAAAVIGTAAATDPPRLLLVDAPAAEDGPPLPRPAGEATPESLAYVLYTSGSTGRPKGVAVEHASVAALLAWADRLLARDELAGMLFSTSICFDLSVFELFLPLAVGGALILADDALALPELPAAGEVTLLNTVPSAAAELVSRGALPPSVATVVCCGEPLPRELVEETLALGTVRRLWNLYGPTEDTVYSTAMAMGSAPGRPVSIGRPIAGGSAWVTDRHGRPVPAGVPGELLLGGTGLARGYLGRAALTAERFVPDPFSGRPGARLYRTGDLARWRAGSARRPAGTLDFLGRLDHQVKLRGFRIELGEIEAALLACPGVGEAVAVVRRDAGDPRLAAYWSAEAGGAAPASDGAPPSGPAPAPSAPAADELRVALAARLPAHMVPSYFVRLAALPRTPNGKVDRKALPDPRPAAGGAAALERRAPADEVEATVVAAFADLLGVAEVGVDDDFFSLGGHSLLAVRLVARLQRQLGAELPLRILFSAPTPAGLAAAVRETRWTGGDVPRRPRGGPLPASFAQERLWFLERLEAGSGLLVIPSAFELAGPLDEPALAVAIAGLVDRHAALRTALVEEDGRLLQRVTPPPAKPALPLVDLAALPAAARRAAVERRLAAEKRRPFDLVRPPLFRATLLRLGPEERVLSTALHHTAGDGWSLSILWRDLSRLYAAARAGRSPALAAPPMSYADFAAWQRERLSAEEGAAEVAWWRERLAGAPEELALPADRPRRARQRHRAGTLRTTLPAATTRALRRLAAERRTTPFTVLVAGLAAVLGRQAGQEEVCLGMPVAGRGRAEIEEVVGLFLNTVVLRLPGAGGGGFGDRVDAARRALTGALAHSDVPFERLLEDLQPHRDLARSPLFQVMVNGLPEGAPRPELPGVSTRPVADAAGAAKLDLTLYVGDDGDALRLGWVWDRDLFDAERIEETARQLEALLATGLAEPERPVGEVSLLTAGAAALPDPAAPLSAAWLGSVPEVFARRAAERPEAPAVLAPDGALTYGELARWSGRIAWHLAGGVRPGEPVAIWAHRSGALVPAVLGTLTAGAAFVMLDPAYPPARLVELVELARPRGFVRLSAAGPLPPEVDAALAAAGCRVRLELPPLAALTEDHPLAAAPAGAPAVELGPDDLAYLAFTSGSTGRPKGIRGRHGSLTHFLPWQVATFGFGAGDRFSLLSGLAHDPLHRDLFTPLQTGGAIVVPEAERIGEPGYLAGWMRRERVTVAHLTPAMGQVVSEPAGRLGAVPEELTAADLRWVFLVGEALTRGHVDRLAAVAPRARAVNFYGSTETQRAVGWHLCAAGGAAGGAADAEVLPLGRGIPDVQLLVVNPAGRPAGVGELGEVWVRSPHVALGYLDDAETTSERFLTNPFSAPADPADRAYRTGDLGRYRPDGEVVFAGRADLQLKVRGFRVEPAEIEAAIERHPAVREAVVVLRDDPAAGALLVAYVVPRPGGGSAPAAAPEPRALRDHLTARLPDYMVPAAFVVLDALPRTPNGKLDRRALPAPGAGDGLAAPAATAPRDPVEETVVAVFAELLPAAAGPVGIDSDFFDLGGHSLLATRVMSRLRQVSGVELPLRELFEAPTPRGLARRLAAALAGERGVALPPIVPVPRDGDLPPTFSQERQWLLERLDPGNPAYHVPLALRLTGDWSPAALAAALDGVVARHESLRTVFAEVDGSPVQRVRPPSPLPMPRVDLAALPEAAARRAARRLRAAEAARPFDLARGPLLRAVLVDLPGERWLVVTLHHVATDGWSTAILVRELRALHDSAVLGVPSPLAPPAIQVGDVAVWQRRHVAGAALAAQVAAWRERLAGVPPLELPTDRPRPALQRHHGVHRSLTLDRQATGELAALARAAGATPFMVLVAAWSALLARRSGRDDFAVGTFIAGRNRAETEGTIGFFVNTLALRVDLSGRPPFAELVARVRRTTLDAYGLQDAPFERVLEAVSPRRDLARSPLFQTLVVLQNLPREPAGGARRCELLGKGGDRSLVDLGLWGRERDGELHCDLEVDRDLFEPATAERLLAELARLLAAVAADPATPIDRLPPPDAGEMDRLLVAWNATATPRPAGCVHEWVLARAAERPEAVAVETAAGRRVTYGELAGQARALAARLAAAGVGREDRVALAVERSPEALAAMLGVALAGAAWVPLDPAWPGERMRRVLADCAAAAVVVAGGGPPPGWQPPAGMPVLQVDDPAPPPAAALPAPPPAAALPAPWEATLAYVLYTSGSTGAPKGVMVEHRSLAAYTAAAASAHGVGRGDRVLQFASLAFDASAEEIWPTLARGATLVLRDDAMLASPADFLAACGRLGITVADLPTAFWHGVAAAVAGGQPLPPALRLVIIGGEQALAGRVAAWRQHAPAVRLLNTYGPTETTVVATSWPAGRGAGGAPIGRPVDNVLAYVVDRRLAPQPAGAPGELAIAGAGVARGYLGRPAATAERFVPDPFGAPGSRLYRSGDRARWRADGELEFLGRLDRQLKVRGVRIEPGEIEAALARRPELAAAVVGVHETAPGEGRLVAWVVPRPGWEAVGGAAADGATSPADLAGRLRAALRRELPDALVPTLFVTLPALPLNAAGKVDRTALPAPELGAAAAAAAWRAPETAAEELLAEIWAEVLRRERVGAGDDFFTLGGHSLLATQVVARVAREIGLSLPLRQVFETPVLADLAADLESRLLAEEAAAAGAVADAVPGDAVPGDTAVDAERDGAREVAV